MVPLFKIQWKSPIFSRTICLQLLVKQSLIFLKIDLKNFLKNRSNISFFASSTDKTEIENVISH